MAKKVKDPKEEPKFRKLGKVDGKLTTKANKSYQIGDKHSIKADKRLRIETNLKVTEHDGVDSLPVELKDKLNKKKKFT